MKLAVKPICNLSNSYSYEVKNHLFMLNGINLLEFYYECVQRIIIRSRTIYHVLFIAYKPHYIHTR